jgi:hypothetical protein
MIRGIIRGKTIEPLDPLPDDWTEGREVSVEALEPSNDPDPTWLADMDRLSLKLGTPEDWDRMDDELAKAKAEAKEMVRRQMGLE